MFSAQCLLISLFFLIIPANLFCHTSITPGPGFLYLFSVYLRENSFSLPRMVPPAINFFNYFNSCTCPFFLPLAAPFLLLLLPKRCRARTNGNPLAPRFFSRHVFLYPQPSPFSCLLFQAQRRRSFLNRFAFFGLISTVQVMTIIFSAT